MKGLRMSEDEKETQKGTVNLTLVRPGSTREEMKQAAIDLYRHLTGKDPTEEHLADLEKRLDKDETK